MSWLGQSLAARPFQPQLQDIAFLVDGQAVFISFCVFERNSSIADGAKRIYMPALNPQRVSLRTGGKSHKGLLPKSRCASTIKGGELNCRDWDEVLAKVYTSTAFSGCTSGSIFPVHFLWKTAEGAIPVTGYDLSACVRARVLKLGQCASPPAVRTVRNGELRGVARCR
jgi:hypothetical protein